MKETVVLGNIITMDERRPTATAALVKDGVFAGYRAIGQANLSQAGLTTDYAKYRDIIKEFIEKNPQREIYLAAGWIQNDEKVTREYLDEICPDKPLIMNSGDAHGRQSHEETEEAYR